MAAAPAPAATTTVAQGTTPTTAYDAGFEEDDEFEEFEDEDWPVAEEDAKDSEWVDDWDDDLVEGDFVNQLRQELANSASAAAAASKQ